MISFTEKQRKLFMNILSVVFISTILYATLSFVFLYNLSINKFTASSDFITIIILGIFTYIGYDIVSGKIKFNKNKFRNSFGKKPEKKKQHKAKNVINKKKQPKGTSVCPQCHHIITGTYCRRCRITWDEDELSY